MSTEKGQDVKVYMHDSSLNARGIERKELVEGIELIDDEKLAELMGASHSVMLF